MSGRGGRGFDSGVGGADEEVRVKERDQMIVDVIHEGLVVAAVEKGPIK